MVYKVVLCDTDESLPLNFLTRQDADDYIFNNQLHAYITIEGVSVS